MLGIGERRGFGCDAQVARTVEVAQAARLAPPQLDDGLGRAACVAGQGPPVSLGQRQAHLHGQVRCPATGVQVVRLTGPMPQPARPISPDDSPFFERGTVAYRRCPGVVAGEAADGVVRPRHVGVALTRDAQPAQGQHHCTWHDGASGDEGVDWTAQCVCERATYGIREPLAEDARRALPTSASAPVRPGRHQRQHAALAGRVPQASARTRR